MSALGGGVHPTSHEAAAVSQTGFWRGGRRGGCCAVSPTPGRRLAQGHGARGERVAWR